MLLKFSTLTVTGSRGPKPTVRYIKNYFNVTLLKAVSCTAARPVRCLCNKGVVHILVMSHWGGGAGVQLAVAVCIFTAGMLTIITYSLVRH